MLDVSDKMVVFIKKLSLQEEDDANVSGSSQCFSFLYGLLEKNVWCCLQVYVVYFCNMYFI